MGNFKTIGGRAVFVGGGKIPKNVTTMKELEQHILKEREMHRKKIEDQIFDREQKKETDALLKLEKTNPKEFKKIMDRDFLNLEEQQRAMRDIDEFNLKQQQRRRTG